MGLEQKILVSKQEVRKLFNTKEWLGNIFASIVMSALRLNKLNRMYHQVYDDDAIKFTDNCIKQNNVKVKTFDIDIQNIPQSGPCIFFFNHPYGLLDALVIINILLKIRPDTKFIANFLLKRVRPIAPYLFGVNPFETRKEVYSSHSGLKQMYDHLKNGGVVVILPAGEVSTKYGKNKFVEDREWQRNMIKFAMNTNVPVISGYCSGENSKLFHFAGKINPSFRTALLPREYINKRNIEVTLRFSSPMSAKAISKFKDPKELGKFLKSKTYLLEYDDKNSIKTTEPVLQPLKELLPENEIIEEIRSLSEEFIVLKNENYWCYFINKTDAPKVFEQITILREQTFREVGEGTGKPFDTDTYDEYYKHLILWDNEEGEIVGSYRIGLGKEILDKFGFNGFYLNSLFKFNPQFEKILSKSMEMGRSFIVSQYQRRPLSLFLLWKGIYQVTQKYPEYKYLIGPASISSEYSLNSQILMVEYLKRHYSDKKLENMVSSITPFKYKKTHHHRNILDIIGSDLNQL
ncbi:MAG: lysophospholipid acyltransferase family protein, partial [Bacteroidales bacterium]